MAKLQNSDHRLFFLILAALTMLVAPDALGADMLSGQKLVDALRQGGYVLVMRHASSPFEKPDKDSADPGNTGLERQLDQTGQETAIAMGQAIKSLGIPIADVLSSPAYRAVETANLAGFAEPMTYGELGEGEEGMKAKISDEQAAWLRHRAEEIPAGRTNTLIVTHTPNILASFGEDAAGIKSGEALVYRPDGKGNTELIARIEIDAWPGLAAAK